MGGAAVSSSCVLRSPTGLVALEPGDKRVPQENLGAVVLVRAVDLHHLTPVGPTAHGSEPQQEANGATPPPVRSVPPVDVDVLLHVAGRVAQALTGHRQEPLRLVPQHNVSQQHIVEMNTIVRTVLCLETERC